MDFKSDYYVYIDGSCSHNGKPNAKSGIGIYFGENDKRNVSRALSGNKHTNNIAELTAFIECHSLINKEDNVVIITDSEYVIKCVTTYGKKCDDKKWSKDIPNIELVKQAYTLYIGSPNISIRHVKAHTKNTDIHSLGNRMADIFAKKYL